LGRPADAAAGAAACAICSSWRQRNHIPDNVNDTSVVVATTPAATTGCASQTTLIAHACMKKLTPTLSAKLF